MRVEKTVFISYRRTNNYQALAVYQHLTGLGYDVFYDLDSIRSGDWKQIILDNIKARAHFLVILTPSAVEHFSEPGEDIMRLEIETAMDSQRNIIPLLFDGFDFNAARPHLTGKLAQLGQYNGLEVPTRFFKYAMQDLHDKHLSQDVTTITYPAPPAAQQYAAQQQADAQREAPVTEKQLSAKEYFERAYRAAENKNYEQAIKDYTEALHRNPNDSMTYNNRGDTLNNIGEYDQAIDDLNVALRLDPSNALAYNNRGRAYRKKGDLEIAISNYDEALRLSPQFTNAYIGRALAYHERQDFDAAIRDYTEALQLKPNDAITLTNRGVAYSDGLGDFERAFADYNEALRLNPQYVDAYRNRGLAYNNKGDYDRAIADYTEALRLNPQDATVYNNRGWAYYNKGDHARARADYEAALRIDPNHALAKANLAKLK